MDFNSFKKMGQSDINNAICYELKEDDNPLVKDIYTAVFPFYTKNKFNGDTIFTWKSAAHVINGDYNAIRKFWIGKEGDKSAGNNHFVGNLFPNLFTDKKHSLNTNRNGHMGDFPHDYIDIYLMHIAKYAFSEKIEQDKMNFVNSRIKEYYPLKRAILFEDNLNYLRSFETFENFLKEHYFEDIWKHIQNIKCFSDMEFEEFKRESLKLIEKRGKSMIETMLKSKI